MPFKKLDNEEVRQIKHAIAKQNGEVIHVENPYLLEDSIFEDEVQRSDTPLYYCKFGRNWDVFNRYFRNLEEAKALAESTCVDIKDTCTVYAANVPGPIFSVYYDKGTVSTATTEI